MVREGEAEGWDAPTRMKEKAILVAATVGWSENAIVGQKRAAKSNGVDFVGMFRYKFDKAVDYRLIGSWTLALLGYVAEVCI